MGEKIEAARNIVLTLQFKGETISSQEINDEWEKLYGDTRSPSGSSGNAVRRMHSFSWKGFLSIAAVLLFLVTSALTARWVVREFSTNDQEFITRATLPGQKLSITLPDGTKIKLNSDSEIKYPSEFTGTLREINLQGEAFFDVVHNDQAPFKVHTSSITVTVLGTSFNVNAYPENTDVYVALEKGKVKVNVKSENNGSGDIFLNPNQIIGINKASRNYEVQHFDPPKTTSWKDGYLCFEKAHFNETIVKLERWFGVKFKIESNFQIDPGWTFTGKFRDKSLPYILQTLSYPDLFKYRIENQKVVITKTQNK